MGVPDWVAAPRDSSIGVGPLGAPPVPGGAFGWPFHVGLETGRLLRHGGFFDGLHGFAGRDLVWALIGRRGCWYCHLLFPAGPDGFFDEFFDEIDRCSSEPFDHRIFRFHGLLEDLFPFFDRIRHHAHAKAQKRFRHLVVGVFFQNFFERFDGLLQLQLMQMQISEPDFAARHFLDSASPRRGRALRPHLRRPG